MSTRVFFGSSRDDEFFGSDARDVVFSSGGNDYINTGGGNDFIISGSGNDVIDAGSGNDFIQSGSGDDTIEAGTGNDFIQSGTGNDTVNAGDGNDFIQTSSGNDTIDAGTGNDFIQSGSGNDIVEAGDGNDFIQTSSGNDTVDAGAGNDFVQGGSGNDRLEAGDGNDFVQGGSGNDTVFGGAGSDRLFGDSGNDSLDGGSGNDELFGGSGNDALTGGAGADRLFGQSGDDTFTITLSEELSGQDQIFGDSGVDTLVLNLTAEEFASQEIADDLNALLDAIDARLGQNGQTNGLDITLNALNLRVNNVETVRVLIDGVEVNPRDAGPSGDDGGDGTGGAIDPIAVDDQFSVAEDAAITGDVTANDTVEDGTTVTLISGVESGTLTLNADGTFSFDAANDFNDLAEGETQDVAFTYELSGGGETTTATATVTVTGTNDAPVVSAPLVAAADEDGESVSLDLLEGAADVDNGAVLSIANVSELPAGVTLDGTTLSVDSSDASFQALAAGETTDITVTYDVTDENGASVAQTATITITGTNDAPTIAAALTETVNEEAGQQIFDLLDGASDVDNGDTLSVTLNTEALPDGFELLEGGQSLSFNPSDNAQAQALAAGETLDIQISYDVVDSLGASTTQTLTITIEGEDEIENIAPRSTQNIGLQAVDFEAAFELILADDQFVDVDGDALTFTAALSNGDPLPSWLTFDAETGALSGTPTILDGGRFTVVITADDGNGGMGTEAIPFIIGDSVIFGTDGDDVLNGNSGADTLIGGLGNDTLLGGFGNDVYVFSQGDGQDIVRESGSLGTADTIQFTDYNLADATFIQTGDDEYVISFENGDSVTVEDALSSGNTRLEVIEFADQTLELADIVATLNASQGTDDDDAILGTDLNDVLNAGAGDDTVSAFDGDDLITGGTGNDTILGGRGNDTYVFSQGDGQDTVREVSSFNTTDTIQFTDYNLADATFVQTAIDEYVITFANGDSVTVEDALASNNTRVEVIEFADQTLELADIIATLNAAQSTDGNDAILGTELNDVLNAGAGDDTVSAFDGDDLITGGTGNDTLLGGRGDDTYVFSQGDGQDIVRESGSFNTTDVIQFTDYNLADAIFIQTGDDEYQITFANGDSVTVEDALSSSFSRIEQIQFADQTLELAEIVATLNATQGTDGDDEAILGTDLADVLNAGAGDDTVSAFGGNDVITGGTGNDTLFGGSGSDTYVFSQGDGQDIVREASSFNTTDIIQFTDYNLADATFVQTGSDEYQITFANGDSVTVEDALSSSFSRIEQIQFADQTLELAEIVATLNATQGTDGDDEAILGTDLADVLNAGAGDDTVSAFGGNDVITGGTGNDTLLGGSGNDTYIFSQGDGQDIVSELSSFNTTDIIQFTDYNLADASFFRSGTNEYIISFANGDTVTVQNGLTGSFTRIEQVQFADQTLSTADVLLALDNNSETDGDDVLTGSNLADIINGGAGDDVLNGGTGDDIINGGSGADTIIGGLGNDEIRGEDGADRFEFASGDGQDTIIGAEVDNANDVLAFTDYNIAEASFTTNENDLIVNFDNGDRVTIIDGVVPAAGNVTSVEFVDETISVAAILAQIITDTQTDGDDIIIGFGTDDTLEGGLGDDALFGGDGDDTYIFNAGDGNDSITDTGGVDTINFGALTVADAIFTETDQGLLIDFGNDDSVEVALDLSAPFTGGPAPQLLGLDEIEDGSEVGLQNDIEFFQFADQTLNLSEVIGMLFVDAPLDEIIEGTDGDDILLGTDGNDTLIGGLGDDTLNGGFGDDLYIFNIGDGSDVINETGGTDTINFGDYAFEDATFSSTIDGILVDFGAGDNVELILSSEIIVGEGFPGLSPINDDDLVFEGDGEFPQFEFPNDVEIFQFSDQTLSIDDVFDIIFAGQIGETFEGTDDDDTLVGTDSDDLLIGGLGDDTLIGGLGNDLLQGGDGNDNYVYTFGDGTDTIEDTGGANDTLTIIGLSSAEVFTFFDFFTAEPIVGLPLDPETGTFGDIFLSDSEIENFVFIEDPANPDAAETLTFEELFGEAPFPGGDDFPAGGDEDFLVLF